ncbi:protein disulfide isomerase MPD2 PWA37_003959 [Arxiozyma heterogenica]|uniref:protein disulfide isomerase MPD2 n=1 Tax=Arxiozyma heterogenica TaxID=278026 RepID=UPI002EE37552
MIVIPTILLFTLTLFNFINIINCKHIEILSIRDFNQIVNTIPNSIDYYTANTENNFISSSSFSSPLSYDDVSINVIKYYTTWCSHCKKLSPIWSRLIKAFPNINFLSIDCDVFGKSLCRDLPGYPIIKIITTQGSDIKNIDTDLQNTDISKTLSWFGYLKSWFMNDPYNTEIIDIDPKRVMEYKGRRDYETMYNFIDSLVQLYQIESQFSRIVYGTDSILDSDLLNSYFSQNLLVNGIISVATQTTNNKNNSRKLQVSDTGLLNKERRKLENIIRNNPGTPELNDIKTKLQFLNWLEDQVEIINEESSSAHRLSNIKDEL